MDLQTFEELLTSAGQELLRRASRMKPQEKTYLQCFDRLHKHYPNPLVRAALETALLRKKATGKFSKADAMYLTREALEQASGEIVSNYRASRYAGFQVVGDFGCGIGGDTIALAGAAKTVAVELDPLRLAMAKQNLRAYNRIDRNAFIEGDLQHMEAPDVDAIFFDPARRRQGRRHTSVLRYQPPLELIYRWMPRTPAIAVKIAPGVSWSQLTAFDAEVEFVSVHGELKECVLWFGALCTQKRRASVLPQSATLSADGASPDLQPAAPLQYLFEPDPAVIRAGLISNLAEELHASQLDEDIAYLTTSTLTESPFGQTYRVEDSFPFQAKRLRQWLHARKIGNVIVKKRGSAVDTQSLIRQLRLSGSGTRFVFLTKVLGKPYILIGERVEGVSAQSRNNHAK